MRGTAKDHKKGVDPKKGPDMRQDWPKYWHKSNWFRNFEVNN